MRAITLDDKMMNLFNLTESWVTTSPPKCIHIFLFAELQADILWNRRANNLNRSSKTLPIIVSQQWNATLHCLESLLMSHMDCEALT